MAAILIGWDGFSLPALRHRTMPATVVHTGVAIHEADNLPAGHFSKAAMVHILRQSALMRIKGCREHKHTR